MSREPKPPADPGEQLFFLFYLGLPALMAIAVLLGYVLGIFKVMP